MAEQIDRRALIMETLGELCGSEEFPELSRIEADEDLTAFTVALTTDTVTTGAFNLAAMLEMYSRSYRMLQGLGEARCAVRFVSADTGDVIEEMN